MTDWVDWGTVTVPSITAGVPDSKSAWPADVIEAINLFSTGSVVKDPPLFYFADPSRAIWAATRPYAEGSAGPEVVDASDYAPPYGIVTSQTCDIGEIEADLPIRPWIMVSPVYDLKDELDGGIRKLLKEGKGPLHQLYLPLLEDVTPGFWVADFRLEFPIEKGWFAGRVPLDAFPSSKEQACVGDRIAKIRSRPAWAETIVTEVQRFLFMALKRLKSEDRDRYQVVHDAISEVGCRVDSMLDPSYVQLCAFYEGTLLSSAADWWLSQIDELRDVLQSQDIAVHQPECRDLRETPVTVYREYSPLPIQRFSPF